jgi:hypothetical protein
MTDIAKVSAIIAIGVLIASLAYGTPNWYPL